MNNFDEMDHISAVYFMSRGKMLYKDIFATHFPLPFYWAYLFSSVWTHPPFYRAITVFRLSLMVFYVMIFVLIFRELKKPSEKNIFSIWILFTSLILGLYHGNLYLSETFSGILLSGVLWLLISKSKNIFLFIILASLAFWTQPLLGLLILIPILLSSKKEMSKTFLTIFGINIVPLVLLIMSGQFGGFLKQAIMFNFVNYSKNFPEQVSNNSMMRQNILNFFDNQKYLLSHFFNSTQIYQFILNLSLIIFSFLFLKKEKWIYKFALATLLLSLMSRQVKVIPGKIFNFGIYPILLCAFVCLLTFLLNKRFRFYAYILVIICFIMAGIDSWPIFKQSLNHGYNYEVFWSYRERIGEEISKFSNVNDRIWIYPHEPDLYFFAQRMPMDRFTYWYPWYDEVPEFKNERLETLKNNPPKIIYYGQMAYKNNPTMYADFFPNMLKNYKNVSGNIWVLKD